MEYCYLAIKEYVYLSVNDKDILEETDGHKGIRVGILYNNLLVRSGLASLFGRSNDLEVIEYDPVSPDIDEINRNGSIEIALAVSSGGKDAKEEIKHLKNILPNAKIIILGISGTEKEIQEYIEAGASGYLLPGSSPDNLLEAIKKVNQGEVSCPSEILPIIFRHIVELKEKYESINDNPLNDLTKREMEILQYISNSMSNKEIADYLNLEVQTIKNHIHHILEKLKVKNRLQAVNLSVNSHKFSEIR
jgi:DNA-binding NarL/FixJ family response regulator